VLSDTSTTTLLIHQLQPPTSPLLAPPACSTGDPRLHITTRRRRLPVFALFLIPFENDTSFALTSFEVSESPLAFSPFAFEQDVNPVIHGRWLPAQISLSSSGNGDQDGKDGHQALSPPLHVDTATSPLSSENNDDHARQTTSPDPDARTPNTVPTAPPHLCPYPNCDANFRLPCHLNDHINRKHVRRYICSTHNCGQAFHLKADLARHTRTHLAPDPSQAFTCISPRCDRAFGRRDNMLRHVRKAH
jgi:uncharacterized C2H2 Zn-finger protein